MAWANILDLFPDGPWWTPAATGISVVGNMIVGKGATINQDLDPTKLNVGQAYQANINSFKGVKYLVHYWNERPSGFSPPYSQSTIAFPNPLTLTDNTGGAPGRAQQFVPSNNQFRSNALSGLVCATFGLARYLGTLPPNTRSIPTDFAIEIYFDYSPVVPTTPEPKVKVRPVPSPLQSCDISDQWSNCK